MNSAAGGPLITFYRDEFQEKRARSANLKKVMLHLPNKTTLKNNLIALNDPIQQGYYMSYEN